MTDTVISALISSLCGYGIRAVREYPDEPADADGAVVCMGIESCKLMSPGCGDYLGTVSFPDSGEHERYGYRCEMTVLMDVFAPRAHDCTECFDSIGSAMAQLPKGIKYRALISGETVYDEVTGLFRCPCRFMCHAMTERSYDAENDRFTDFTLRGVLADHGD